MQMGKSLDWEDARLLVFAAAVFPGTSLFATERMAVKALIPFVRLVICLHPHRSRNPWNDGSGRIAVRFRFVLLSLLMSAITRRSILSLAASVATLSAAKKKIPIGLELYSVRKELAKDLMGTVRAVAKMGYEGVEFFSTYMQWTPEYAKEVRKLLDDIGLKALSTHNSNNSFTPELLPKAIELNSIIGSKFIIMASAGRVNGLDGWKKVAEQLNKGAEGMKSAGLRAGFHNHQLEFTPIEGKRPMEVLAENTGKDVVLQLDVGTAIEANTDPLAWIKEHPGRIVSMHAKDYKPGGSSREEGYRVLFGEGAAKWKELFKAAEKTGGLQYYLVEQEGSRYSELETAEKCLVNFRKMHG